MDGGDPAQASCGWGGRRREVVVACGGAETGGGEGDTCAAREHEFTFTQKNKKRKEKIEACTAAPFWVKLSPKLELVSLWFIFSGKWKRARE